MDNEVVINIVEIIDDGICVTDGDGQKIYSVIENALSDGKKVIISFDGVIDLTSAFLNNAIGQLYGNFDEAYIRSKLSVINMDKNDRIILKMVVDRAKRFFDDPDHYIRVAKEVLGDDNGN
ncbi:STAS-like domain-containing protein [Methanococcoides methylutens]|uniref:STAS-like domain-containing protein n=1 Tax=Methanococcoides methylutens TaxID=2226 RepID=UPI00064F1E0E|nr:STAS-like domain-containing protein [Methanococcoides methylutens]